MVISNKSVTKETIFKIDYDKRDTIPEKIINVISLTLQKSRTTVENSFGVLLKITGLTLGVSSVS